jgi:hypothetical protein
MKLILPLCFVLLALVSPAYGAGQDQAKPRAGTLRHVVAFKFKEEATRSQIEAVEKAFAELPKKIKVIQHYEWGTDSF